MSDAMDEMHKMDEKIIIPPEILATYFPDLPTEHDDFKKVEMDNGTLFGQIKHRMELVRFFLPIFSTPLLFSFLLTFPPPHP